MCSPSRPALPAFFSSRHLVFDDGTYGVSVLDMRHGLAPYRGVFSAQGPLHFSLLYLGDLLGFRTIDGPRVTPMLAGIAATSPCGRSRVAPPTRLPAAGVVFVAANAGFGRSIAGFLSVAWLLFATGCLHEDGLADVADAVRAGRSRERILTILKDSRIGAYGALALIVSVALRWQSMAVACKSGVRISCRPGAFTQRPRCPGCLHGSIGNGLGSAFAAEISEPGDYGHPTGGGYRVACGLDLCPRNDSGKHSYDLLARAWFLRRLGGVNGDCLGATCQAVETVNLVILAWRHSI